MSCHSESPSNLQTHTFAHKRCTESLCADSISAIDSFSKQCTQKRREFLSFRSFVRLRLSLCVCVCVSCTLHAAVFCWMLLFYLLKNGFCGSSRHIAQIITTSASAFTSAFYTETNKDNCDLYPRELEIMIKNERRRRRTKKVEYKRSHC